MSVRSEAEYISFSCGNTILCALVTQIAIIIVSGTTVADVWSAQNRGIISGSYEIVSDYD